MLALVNLHSTVLLATYLFYIYIINSGAFSTVVPYFQISVLPQLAKVLEKLQLSLHRQDLEIRNNQHAFIQNRSTVSALACISQKWFNATDNSPDGRMGVHALFLDFRKAFDMVDHGILLRKLAELNINKNLWLRIQSFLDGRSQQVKLNSFLSTVSPCPAGVPQGSVISPTLFNVYVNDVEDSIPNSLAVNTHKYADDCTLDESVKEGYVSNICRRSSTACRYGLIIIK